MFVISQLWVRLLGTGLFLAALVFFACPFVVGIHHAGCIFGTVISVMGIVFFAMNPVISGVLQKIWKNDFGHVVLCVFGGFLCLGIVLALVLSIFMLCAAYNKPKEEATVTILGCQVKNGAPSLMLKKRLDAALVYLNQHENVPVIVCGGQGKDEAISEAECMSEYLLSHGIEKERLIIEDRSLITYDNAVFSYAILREQYPQVQNLVIVSSDYHIPLGCILFEAECLLRNNGGYDPHVIANVGCVTDGRYYFGLQDQAKQVKGLFRN